MLPYSKISSNYQLDKVLLFSFNDFTKNSDTFSSHYKNDKLRNEKYSLIVGSMLQTNSRGP